MNSPTHYDEKYAGSEFYWGKAPSALCERVTAHIHPKTGFCPRLLDLGCGEGRDAVHFARLGFDVVGLDASTAGLEKTRRYAGEAGVRVETLHATLATWRLEEDVDVVYSNGTLQYLPPEIRATCFENYKVHTKPGGLHVLSAFVKKPFIPPAPDSESTEILYRSGELMGFYWDWEIVDCAERIFDCRSSGVPHRHAVNIVVARPPILPG